MKKFITVIFGISLLFFLATNCTAQKEAPIENQFTISFLQGSAERFIKPGKLKAFDTLPVSEIVKTEASAILDLSSVLGSMRLLGNTKVSLAQLSEDQLMFEVTEGNILVKSAKLKKGQTLKVSTPTVVAAVRGTEFWGQVNKETTTGTFAVRDGAVEILRKSDNSSIVIEKGQALDIDPKAKEWKVRTAKQGELDAMAQIDQIK